MTQNQIAYWNLQETKRSNATREQETNRHNVATERENERHNTVSEGEIGRHNVVTERETTRHNRETENFNISQLQESQRHNVATENLGHLQLNESVRHNTVSEQQNAVANTIKSRANDINEAYNNAIIALRQQEYTLASNKEIQRIEESLRDFNEAVRMNDAKLIIDAFDSGNDTVRSIFGTKGLVGAGLLGAGAVGTVKAAKGLRPAVPSKGLRPDIFKPASSFSSAPTPVRTPAPSTFDMFLVPSAALDLFKQNMYTKDSNSRSNSRWD